MAELKTTTRNNEEQDKMQYDENRSRTVWKMQVIIYTGPKTFQIQHFINYQFVLFVNVL